MTDLAATFRKPFAEQVAAFRLRLADLVPTVRWDDISHNQHDRAFMVAGALKADLLADLAAAVDKAVTQGTTLEEFQRDFRAIVEKNGWHGWTGEGTAKGEAWRTRVIYRTNLATSYATGRRAQLIAGDFKYWVYRHGGSLEPRLQHLAWDGIALPPDHPFWVTHAPPNGWGCKCRIFGARTEAGIRRVGGVPGKELPDGWDSIDPRTGVQVGIDKGWGYAPGASVAEDVLALRGKLDVMPEQPAIDLIQSWVQSELFANWFAAPKGTWPLARISAEDAAKIGSRQTTASLSAESAMKQARNHPDLTPADYALAQSAISNATQTVQQDARRLIFIQEVDGASGYVLVVKAVVEQGELFVVSFRRMSRDEGRRDQDIRNLLRKGE